MKRNLWGVLCVVLLSMPLYAQDLPPALIIIPDPARPQITQPMSVSRVAVDVKVSGCLAETSMTMTFANPSKRALAGDLYFPLPEGATVSGYALDINGNMVDGVVVEKEKGRQVFEKIVRQGIDPGLVEYTKGNTFKTRVFPVPARGSRIVRVSYVSELLSRDGTPAYQLPLRYREKVGEFYLRVEVVKTEVKPEIRSGGLDSFQFEKWRDSYLAETTLKDQVLNQDLVIAFPDVERRAVALESNENGNTYFVIHDEPQAPKEEPATVPSRIELLWDASGSRDTANRAKEISLLRAYFSGTAPGSPASIKDQSVTVNLVLFRNEREAPRSFEILHGNSDALIEALETAPYDGGTQYGCVSPSAGEPLPDFYLLFSDGIGNFGESEPGHFERPVYAFSADSEAAHPALRYLAAQTGGSYFNLSRLETEAVIGSIGRTCFSLLSAEVKDAEIAEVLPGFRCPVTGRITVTGKLLSDRADIILHYGSGSQTMQLKTYSLSKADAVTGDLLRKFWAQKKLDELMMRPEDNEEEIVETGRLHGLVTPGTSLIVLDNLEQYVEHEIRPPATLPDMRRAYDERMAEKDKDKREKTESKIERILVLWKERVQWWEKQFKYPKNFVFDTPPPERSAGDRNEGDGSSRSPFLTASPAMVQAMPPLAAEAPPPMEASPSPGASSSAEAAESMQGPAPEADANLATAEIELKPWDPETPYLDAIKKASTQSKYSAYLEQKREFGKSPAFYLDCADYFREEGDAALSLRMLSNIAEMELENAALLRVLAHRLAQWDLLDPSIRLFEAVLKLRGEEPQSYRDLALVLARRAEAHGLEKQKSPSVAADFTRAIELLYHVVLNRWDRFEEIELTALLELNRIIPLAKQAGVTGIPVDERLIQRLDLDIRIVMTWDADLTDLDLWVTEPSGEKAMYNHPLTTIGGKVSRDFTQGYGPEEYLLRRAMPGPYKIETNFFGSSAQALIGAVTLQVDVFTHYGRPNEERQSVTLRLKDSKETISVAEIRFLPEKAKKTWK